MSDGANVLGHAQRAGGQESFRRRLTSGVYSDAVAQLAEADLWTDGHEPGECVTLLMELLEKMGKFRLGDPTARLKSPAGRRKFQPPSPIPMRPGAASPSLSPRARNRRSSKETYGDAEETGVRGPSAETGGGEMRTRREAEETFLALTPRSRAAVSSRLSPSALQLTRQFDTRQHDPPGNNASPATVTQADLCIRLDSLNVGSRAGRHEVALGLTPPSPEAKSRNLRRRWPDPNYVRGVVLGGVAAKKK